MKRFLIAAAALLAGCAPDPVPQTTNGIIGNVYEFHLNDGTRCVAWKLGYGGGLSCDFR